MEATKILSYAIIIFDADATIRRCTVANQPCPNAPGEWELIAGVKERLAVVPWQEIGIRIGIASNQAGVAAGYLTAAMARQLLCQMFDEALGFNDNPSLKEKHPN